MLEDFAYKLERLCRVKHLGWHYKIAVFHVLKVCHILQHALRQLQLRLNHLNVFDCPILFTLSPTNYNLKLLDELQDLVCKELYRSERLTQLLVHHERVFVTVRL